MTKNEVYKLFSDAQTLVVGVSKAGDLIRLVTTKKVFIQPIGWNIIRIRRVGEMLEIELETLKKQKS